MSELDLGAIEAREKAAQDGPWYDVEIVYWPENWPRFQIRLRDAFTLGAMFERDNAAFIAHAREDIPALLARVRELEKRVLSFYQADDGHIRELGITNDELQRKVEHLQERLAFLEGGLKRHEAYRVGVDDGLFRMRMRVVKIVAEAEKAWGVCGATAWIRRQIGNGEAGE